MMTSTTPQHRANMRTDALEYQLPVSSIATQPMQPRDAARLLVVYRDQDSQPDASNPGRIEHHHVRDLPAFLPAVNSVLVFNRTAVRPARIEGVRDPTGGLVSGLVVDEWLDEDDGALMWLLMLRSSNRLKPGTRVRLVEPDGRLSAVTFELLERVDAMFIAAVEWNVESLGPGDILERYGLTPLPPYILRARSSESKILDREDREWYQTVYADSSMRHSVAAPTAGLHFTEQLLKQLNDAGVQSRELFLHVGMGTFKPIEADSLDAHIMHKEVFAVATDVLHDLVQCRATGAKVIAVGTTTVRCLESIDATKLPPRGKMLEDETELMITPGFAFQWVDGLLTNFHLPRSTLLALVGAMVGLPRLLAIYQEATRLGYRFYSYGDAMLILPEEGARK
ncbi:MAG: tRNA preQ1(34) S-adenosylmethionine ribosyltransferase-isomerase QueA [Phycisphaerales bacterium]